MDVKCLITLVPGVNTIMLMTNKLARLTLASFYVLVKYFRSLPIDWRSVRFFTWVDYLALRANVGLGYKD